MIKYPISFFAKVQSAPGIQNVWTFESQNLEFTAAIPTEFEGPGGALSPEDLFAQALANCFTATFKVYAEKSKLTFESLKVNAELIVDLDEKRRPVMKKSILSVQISGSSNPERLKFIAEKAFESGFILNSVKTEVILDLQIS